MLLLATLAKIKVPDSESRVHEMVITPDGAEVEASCVDGADACAQWCAREQML